MSAERNTDVICEKAKAWLEMRAQALCGLFETMSRDEAWGIACHEFKRLIEARVISARRATA